mgnify:CR=1 FL=1
MRRLNHSIGIEKLDIETRLVCYACFRMPVRLWGICISTLMLYNKKRKLQDLGTKSNLFAVEMPRPLDGS